jgi:hypothetical protein
MNIRFRGGPLGGQVRDIKLRETAGSPRFPPYFSVAVCPPLELRTVDRVINPYELVFTKVDYELVRVGRDYWDFEYHTADYRRVDEA